MSKKWRAEESHRVLAHDHPIAFNSGAETAILAFHPFPILCNATPLFISCWFGSKFEQMLSLGGLHSDRNKS